jgi:SAM-dependent methyltransferase
VTPAPDRAGSYNPDDFARLRALEDTHFWFVSRNNVLSAVLSTLSANGAAGSKPASVLEIGCGTGNTLRVLRRGLPEAAIIGMDAFHSGLMFARRRGEGRLVQARIEQPPFRKQFGLIGMFDVLEHVEDDVGALQAVRQLLEPGGTLMMTVPAGPSLWSRYDEESRHHRRYTEHSLLDALAAGRLHVEYVTHFMAVTYPAIWLSRRIDRWLATEKQTARPAIERELNVPHSLNTLFEWMLRVESAAIRRRRRVPFGASLLAIARPSGSG